MQRFALGCTVGGTPFFKRQPLAGRRHHPTTNCGKLVTAAVMRSALTSVRRSSAELQQHERRKPWPASAQCPACFVPYVLHALMFCLHTLLCLHVARMPTVLRCFAHACFIIDHAGGGCTLPCCSRTSPPATAGNKRRLGKGLQKRRLRNGRSVECSVACYVLYLCRHAFAGEPRFSMAHIRHSRVYRACETEADIPVFHHSIF